VRKKVPSLSSLLAFEAASRYLSFTRAAIELSLTQTAISHQIKNLEDFLQIQLFVRNPNGLALTENAKEYLITVRETILSLSNASQKISNKNDSNSLIIECLGAFAIKKLIPNLKNFKNLYPHIEIKLNTIHGLHTTFKHNFEIGIWHGNGNWPGIDSESLGVEYVFPVCSPNLLVGATKLENPKDLENFSIIRSSCPILGDEWPYWFEVAGYSDIKLNSSINCDYFISNIECAVNSLGITLGRSTIVENEISSGTLIEPFKIRAKSNNSYHVTSPREFTNLEKVKLFKKWLLDEFKIS